MMPLLVLCKISRVHHAQLVNIAGDDSHKQAMRHARKKHSKYPKEPASLLEFDVPKELTMTHKIDEVTQTDHFLLDDIKLNKDRILIFATNLS